MHTQHVKFSTYVRGDGEDVVVDAVVDSLPSSFSSSEGTGDEPVAAAELVVMVLVAGIGGRGSSDFCCFICTIFVTIRLFFV
jgi:hypothetical protein